ncbi:MAG: DUF1131 family protein [Bdellovibrionales bacterium]
MRTFFYILISAVAFSSFGQAVKDLSLSERAVGLLTKDTKANLATLKKLFPYYEVKNEQNYSEGESTGESFMVYESKKHLLNVNTAELNSSKIFSIEIFDPADKTPDGFGVGNSVDSLINAKKALKCWRGMEEKSDTAICRVGNQEHLLYTFVTSLNDRDIPGSELKVTKGDGRKISSIVWKP